MTENTSNINNMAYVINFMSGPCSGKSTLAAELFVHMKKKGYKVEYLQETCLA